MTESDDWPSYLRAAMAAANGGRGMSQAELARASGISDGTISKWLAGVTQPTIPQLRRLQEVFGIPVLKLAVAAGHFSPKEAQMRERPQPPAAVAEDVVEEEIRAAGYPPEVTEKLLKMRAENREEIRKEIAWLRSIGALNGTTKADTRNTK